VNEEGKLLDHDGLPLDLKYPMTSAERKQLVREVRELLQPIASQTAEYQCSKAMTPLKRQLILLENTMKADAEKFLQKMETEISSVITQFSKELDEAKETIESNLRAIQRMRARDHADNDTRHIKNEESIARNFAMLDDHA